MTIDLFQKEDFVSHAGLDLTWKIEMDALSFEEWKCIAHMIMEHEPRPFCSTIGVPRGGMILSKILNQYSTQNFSDPYLIVDDVLTTGGSMDEFTDSYFRNRDTKNGHFGWVVFARTKPQDWIKALFQMPPIINE